MDLYDHAAALPQRLRGDAQLCPYGELRGRGLSDRALGWRTSRGQLTHPHRGVYLAHTTPLDLLDRARAALSAAPRHAMVGFHTAAALLGFGVMESPTIHLVVPAGTAFPQRPGITAHQVALPVGEPADVLGLPCVPAPRCAIDLTRTLPRLDAIAVLDAALRAGPCTEQELRDEVLRHYGLRGVCQARELVPLADRRAECRQESQLRLVLHDGGLNRFEPQLEVRDRFGIVRHRLDLGDPWLRVGVEYDGASHVDRARVRSDRSRHNWLASYGWELRYFTDRDLYRRTHHLIRTVRAAQACRLPAPGRLI